MKEIDLKEIKSMEELKKELGNMYDEIMYKMNLELCKRLDKAIELTENLLNTEDRGYYQLIFKEQLKVLKGEDK